MAELLGCGHCEHAPCHRSCQRRPLATTCCQEQVPQDLRAAGSWVRRRLADGLAGVWHVRTVNLLHVDRTRAGEKVLSAPGAHAGDVSDRACWVRDWRPAVLCRWSRCTRDGHGRRRCRRRRDGCGRYRHKRYGCRRYGRRRDGCGRYRHRRYRCRRYGRAGALPPW
jgi:hypothetical protein